MNIKYDNSMYTTIPPTPFIAPMDVIDEHNFQLSYEEQEIRSFDNIERTELNELIKNEPNQEHYF